MIEYWREALEVALEEAGAFGKLDDAQLDGAAKVLMSWAADASTASGRDCIPNPLRAELKQTTEAHEADRKRADAEHAKELASLRQTIDDLQYRNAALQNRIADMERSR